jgi:hypothetical protein
MKQNNIFNTGNSSSSACPVSYTAVDKYLIKAYSLIVLLTLIYTLLTANYFPLYLITLDFVIRVFLGIKYSPLCNFLTFSLKISPLKPLLVNAGTKKIAAQVGLIFCILICVFHLLNFSLPATVFIWMFVIAISIDLLFDYCLACKLRQLLISIR